MDNVLIVINYSTYFTGLSEIGRMLNKKPRYKPIFYFPNYYLSVDRDISICRRDNMRYIVNFDKYIKKDIAVPSDNFVDKNIFKNKIRKLLVSIYSLFFVGFIYEFLHYYREFKTIRRLIIKENPKIVILGGDNTGCNTDVVIKICQNFSISTVIIPDWMAGPSEAAETYYNNPMHDFNKLSNHIVGRIFPKLTYVYKGKKMLRWPAFRVLVMKLFGLEHPLPWVLHSGYADFIFAESEVMYNYMLNEGLPSKNIIITGSLRHDMFARCMKNTKTLRRKLYKGLGFSNYNLPMILFALPPNQLYNYGRPDCDFKGFKELVDFFIKSLTDIKGYNIVVNLHPSLIYEQMTYIKSRNIKIFKGNLSKVMPLCDIFIAGMSSTVAWAIVCGKPVLNYNVYKYKYHDFDGVEGVLNITEKDDYLKYLKKLTEDKIYYRKIANKQKKYMNQWGMLDGKSQVRILKLLETIGKYKKI